MDDDDIKEIMNLASTWCIFAKVQWRTIPATGEKVASLILDSHHDNLKNKLKEIQTKYQERITSVYNHEQAIKESIDQFYNNG